MKAPAGNRHRRNQSCGDDDGLYVGTAVRIRKRQSDLVRRVRAEEENAAREHIGAVVVDPNERQRRPPSDGPGDSKLHGRRGVVISIADDIPLDADRRDRRVGSNRAGCPTVRLRRETCGRDSAAQHPKDSRGHASQAGSRPTPRGAAVRGNRQGAHGVFVEAWPAQAATEMPLRERDSPSDGRADPPESDRRTAFLRFSVTHRVGSGLICECR